MPNRGCNDEVRQNDWPPRYVERGRDWNTDFPWSELDDQELDDDYSSEEPELDDFNRGGK
jgi:hypothetical protein